MAFRSRKLAKTLALAASCSSFVCQSRVSCVKKWALGDTERSDDKESLCINPISISSIRRFKTKGIYGFFDVKTKFLCIDGVGEINKDILKNINNVFLIKDVKSVSIGKDIIFTYGCLKDFVSLESVTVENSRLRTKLIRNKGKKGIIRYLRQNIDDLIPTSQRIDDYAFRLSALKKVIISKNVSEIGKGVFEQCESLEEVQFPDPLEEVQLPGSLEEVQLPGLLRKIGDDVFYCCSALKSIKIPQYVTEIGNNVFNRCKSLEKVQFSYSLRKIGYGVFYCCSALKSISIPQNVTEMGDSVFNQCESLEKVELPASLRKIGDNVFYCCSALKSIKIPQYVTEIGDNVFNRCKSLEKVELPASLRKIGYGAFRNCSALTSIEIPENVEEIGQFAFYNCNSLSTARVPRNAKIGQDAFPEATNVIIY